MSTTNPSLPAGNETIVNWAHFGDLHLTNESEQNFKDFENLIEQVNQQMVGGLSFALLPGDIAEDGTEAQYDLALSALKRLDVPVLAIPGDHDRKTGTLENFWRAFPNLPLSFSLDRYRFLLLNCLDGEQRDAFDLGEAQQEWLADQLELAKAEDFESVIFMHQYPSEFAFASPVQELLNRHRVLLIEMGHTHYNELANDGRIIYATTRSTGQIEEGPVGFSVTSLDKSVVTWKFNQAGTWPLVMITNPVDTRLITRPEQLGQILRGTSTVRARVWGTTAVITAMCRVGNGKRFPMLPLFQPGVWGCQIETRAYPDGEYVLIVEIMDSGGLVTADSIDILIMQSGVFQQPERSERDMDNHVGAYQRKGILGTQLGPNKNGRKW